MLFSTGVSYKFMIMEYDSGKKRKGRAKNADTPDQRKYQCVSCDRKYLSYSALYTHNKIKHNITISTKGIQSRPEPQVQTRHRMVPLRSREVTPGVAKPYQTGNSRGNNGAQTQNLDCMSLEMVIIQFIEYDKKSIPSNPDASIYYIMDQLMNCINTNPNLLEPYELNQNYTQKRSAAFVPLIFNYFLNQYIPKQAKQLNSDRNKIIQLLYRFWKWMFFNKATMFEVNLSP